MESFVNRFQPALLYLSVDLRGGNVCVPEQFLDDAQVRAICQQMGRERMP
jgi:hypothetical protein